MAQVVTTFSFNNTDGADPQAGLIADVNGDLFGTTRNGTHTAGTVFEIKNIGTVAAPIYASVPITLASFNGTDGKSPVADLTLDAAGNLIGTTYYGGPGGVDGVVFEIKNTGTHSAPVYAGTPTPLVDFNGANGQNPAADVFINAEGDLIGTTEYGGTNNDGTVFEIKNTGTLAAPAYASTPTTLLNFDASSTFNDGKNPVAGLIADANGDLFGTTLSGGNPGVGTVFEIKNNGTPGAPVYATLPVTLGNFTDANGRNPAGDLIIDAHGDLFGTSSRSGAFGNYNGTVFEIQNTGTVASPAYALGVTTLVDFNSSGGHTTPVAGLTTDANGDLFGTTEFGGTHGDGTVFVLRNLGTADAPAYSGTPTTLLNFDGANGANPYSKLTFDANGNLLGTTSAGGANNNGTTFEILHAAALNSSILWRDTGGNLDLWSSNATGGFTGEGLGNLSSDWQLEGTGYFNGNGEDSLIWRNSSSGDVFLWNPNGSGGFTGENLGVVSGYQLAATGDFNGDGEDSIVWSNSSSGDVFLWNPNGSGGFTGQDLGDVPGWQIEGTGDFTGNGRDDILWRNKTSGDVFLWNSNGSGGFTGENLGVLSSAWQFQGAGDFTGNGADSIVWRNTTSGDVDLWNPNGSGGFNGEDLGVLGTTWQFQGIGDFGGNGLDDILWRNTANGDAFSWNSNGAGGFSGENLGVVGTSWSVQKVWPSGA